MHFTEDKPAGNYIINEYSKNSVTINGHCFKNSLYLSPHRLIDSIPLQSTAQLSQDAVQFVTELNPEILIIGSGATLSFPPADVIAHFAYNKIGLETMDHCAACRTYSVLSAEQRDVGLLLLIQ